MVGYLALLPHQKLVSCLRLKLQRIVSLTYFIITVNVVTAVEISKRCMMLVVFYFVLIFH